METSFVIILGLLSVPEMAPVPIKVKEYLVLNNKLLQPHLDEVTFESPEDGGYARGTNPHDERVETFQAPTH